MAEKRRKQTKINRILRDARVHVGALIFVCFLLGSTGWLAWFYRITSLAEPTMVDFYTMVLGYLSQIVGIGVYMLVRRKASSRAITISTMVSIALYVVLLEPATMSSELALILAFGYAMNVCCGYTQGHYLTCLAESVGPKGRGVAFGVGYAASTFATWLLSSISSGALTVGAYNLIVCILLAILTIFLIRVVSSMSARDSILIDNDETTSLRVRSLGGKLLVLAGVTVVVVSMVKNAGFSFPTADLSGVVDLELSRLFYGVGLILAGIIADIDRRYVLVCCEASLVTPFLMLALTGAGVSSVALWALGYLLFGFFSVFRVVLFADLARDDDCLWLASAGLLLGRVGDVLGTALFIVLAGSAVILVAVSAVAFVVATILLFLIFDRIYGNELTLREKGTEEDLGYLDEFCKRYGLSNREQEVLSLLVKKRTNIRIAEELCISEPTVKYHVRNILKKTDCTNRVEVIALYETK